LKRVEVTVRAENVALLRDIAARLRTTAGESKRLKAVLAPNLNKRRGLAEALYDPILAGREFDEVFEEIERSRHAPEMLKSRDVEL
jgi:hypothetical protein